MKKLKLEKILFLIFSTLGKLKKYHLLKKNFITTLEEIITALHISI